MAAEPVTMPAGQLERAAQLLHCSKLPSWQSHRRGACRQACGPRRAGGRHAAGGSCRAGSGCRGRTQAASHPLNPSRSSLTGAARAGKHVTLAVTADGVQLAEAAVPDAAAGAAPKLKRAGSGKAKLGKVKKVRWKSVPICMQLPGCGGPAGPALRPPQQKGGCRQAQVTLGHAANTPSLAAHETLSRLAWHALVATVTGCAAWSPPCWLQACSAALGAVQQQRVCQACTCWGPAVPSAPDQCSHASGCTPVMPQLPRAGRQVGAGAAGRSRGGFLWRQGGRLQPPAAAGAGKRGKLPGTRRHGGALRHHEPGAQGAPETGSPVALRGIGSMASMPHPSHFAAQQLVSARLSVCPSDSLFACHFV